MRWWAGGRGDGRLLTDADVRPDARGLAEPEQEGAVARVGLRARVPLGVHRHRVGRDADEVRAARGAVRLISAGGARRRKGAAAQGRGGARAREGPAPGGSCSRSGERTGAEQPWLGGAKQPKRANEEARRSLDPAARSVCPWRRSRRSSRRRWSLCPLYPFCHFCPLCQPVRHGVCSWLLRALGGSPDLSDPLRPPQVLT